MSWSSPVGAINNGVELIEEMGAEMADEAIGLIAHQRQSGISPASSAFGWLMGRPAATRPVSPKSPQAADGYFAGGKIKLEWPPGPHQEQAGPASAGYRKSAAQSGHPGRGSAGLWWSRIVSRAGPRRQSPWWSAIGRNAGLQAESAQALTGDIAIDSLNPAYRPCLCDRTDLPSTSVCKVVASQVSPEDFRVHLAKLSSVTLASAC